VSERVFQVGLRARWDIERGAAWWRRYRDKAPGKFRLELERVFAKIQAYPEIGVRQISRRNVGLRRYPIRSIRFTLWYILTDDTIEILALNHGAKRPPRL
jgi:plasmid stabilization system protein ParE